ncbi:MAG: thrombospondin type 3 repeat-containing protein [Oligoflexia bacterium]|nr:thrombospondin type 3 repeat-containing protein [Oligoflexia bacterium]
MKSTHSPRLSRRSFSFSLSCIFTTLLASAVLIAARDASAADCNCGSLGNQIPISSLPLFENFTSYAECGLDGPGCSAACPFPGTATWQNVAYDDIDWTINAGGTPTDNTGPSAGSGGSGKYIYTESSCIDIGHPDKTAVLQSGKCFNFVGVTPELNFDYHMAGEETGEIHVEISTPVSGDNCQNWQEMAVISGPQQETESESWRNKVVDLHSLKDLSGVRIRFRGVTGKREHSDMGVDNITVKAAPAHDLSIVQMVAPADGCGLTGTQTVSLVVENKGTEPESGFSLAYQLDSQAPVVETFTNFLQPGTQAVYNFVTKANLSVVGEHTLTGMVTLAGDERMTNDSVTKSVENVPTISTYPYIQTFESGRGGWVASGLNSSWAFGLPQKSVITGAFSGFNAWVTGGLGAGLYRNNENSRVLGPCFNFTNLKYPVMSLRTWWNAEGGYDGAVLQSSIDNGSTWKRVGSYTNPVVGNWYNSSNVIANPGGQTEAGTPNGWNGSNQDSVNGGSNGWMQSNNILTGLATKPAVRLRVAFASDSIVRDDGFAFDDVVVQDGLVATKTAALTDTNGNNRADAGEKITYTLKVKSTSFRNITSVVVNDTPDINTQLDYISDGAAVVTTTSGSVVQGNGSGHTAVQVNIPTITPSQEVTVTIRVKVKTLFSASQVCNQGSVTGSGFSGILTDNPNVGGSSDSTCTPGCTDTDGDGSNDCIDNCPSDPNKTAPGQCGCGVADTDSDGDGTANCLDLCPADPNKIAAGQCGCGTADTDSDGDGTANCNDQCPNSAIKTAPGVCGCAIADTDSDGDGTPNCNDSCPNDPAKLVPGLCGCGTADTDSDSDGTPNCNDGCPNSAIKTAPGVCGCNVLDTDTDGDGTPNCTDACPSDPLKIAAGSCGCGVSDQDLDNNGTPDCHDACPPATNGDADGDGVHDCQDTCPNDPQKPNPLPAPGQCGCGNLETDTDGDTFANCVDACPADPNKHTNPGACGCGVADTDSDNDGTPNCNDGCPNSAIKTAPGVCGCNVADTDSDSDGTPNCNDACPSDPAKTQPGVCGCGNADTDSDGDGVANCVDLCPNDVTKTQPGVCGCNVADTDSDGDGTANCHDSCPSDPTKVAPGICGCGNSDADSDGDGTVNCHDACPSDPFKTTAGICGCGVLDTDSDADGTADCNDQCPVDPAKLTPGACGCGELETDSDGDGTPNCVDGCPADPIKLAPGVCGCGISDADSDNDGTANCQDGCPNDHNKLAPGICGCGILDVDDDVDGVANCQESCPNDPNKTAPGVCGCGVSDVDSDNDGVSDCIDQCPANPALVTPGVCGCGPCADSCPNDPNKTAPGFCGCGIPDSDLNGNTVVDCQANADLKKEMTALDGLVRKLKKPSKNIIQVQTRSSIATRLALLKQVTTSFGAQVVLTSSKKTLAQLVTAINAKVGKAAKVKDPKKLPAAKLGALKTILALAKVLK